MDYDKLDKPFVFKGKTLTYNKLKEFRTVEVMMNTNSDTRAFVKDEEENLYYYYYHEEMGIPNDVSYEFFFLVEDENQKKTYLDEDPKNLVHLPHIFVSPAFEIFCKENE